MLAIGQLSNLTGVKIPTIRYYEQVGLIEASERTEGNQRRFMDSDRARLEFIKHARDLGFSIDAIRDLIALAERPGHPCAEADSIAKTHLAAVTARIEKLTRLKSELERIAHGCDADVTGECQVLRALSDHSLCVQNH